MSIKSIEIRNLLSFEHILIEELSDINCIVGKNNAGKSNLLKLVSYFYESLNGIRKLPPELNSQYSSSGSISITYDTSRIFRIVTGHKGDTPFFRHIYNTLFSDSNSLFGKHFLSLDWKASTYVVSLVIGKDGSTKWIVDSENALPIIGYLYPFFEIETRHIDLYDWEKLWTLISKLKSFNVKKLESSEIIDFFNNSLSDDSNAYKDYVERIQNITKTARYSYRDRVLSYVKVGLEGHTFNIEGETLEYQSDGTNSHRYIELFVELTISLTRRDYIQPTLFIDEPEVGLHPSLSEKLILRSFEIYRSYKKTRKEKETGKYSTPYPKILISTHSPSIVKTTIKLFPDDHKLFHFSKDERNQSISNLLVSQYSDSRFLNIFSDNEARLFFSDFILFVEGATEIELFRNFELGSKFKQLRKTDVYAVNNVTFEAINPNYSGAAIPYVMLNDLDVLVEIDLSSKCLGIINKTIKLKTLSRKHSRSYFNSDERKIYEETKTTIGMHGATVDLGSKGIETKCIGGIEGFNIDDFVFKLNNNVLYADNRILSSSTTEGLLICPSSIKMLSKWFCMEVLNNLNTPENPAIAKKIDAFMGKTDFSVKASVDKAMIGLLSPGSLNIRHSRKHRIFLVRLKIIYIRNVIEFLQHNFEDENEAAQAIRLLFGGKTDSLVSLESKKKKYLDPAFLKSVSVLKEELAPIDHLFAKTSGWITRFLNFSVYQLAAKQTKSSFESEFRSSFPELYDILERLRPG